MDYNTNDSVDVDDVSAPIPPTIENFIDYDPYALAMPPQSKRIRFAFDGFQSTDGDESANYGANSSSKSKSLESLFKPPVDLLFNETFEAVRYTSFLFLCLLFLLLIVML